MKIIERWREHRGSVDERVEAESNRVYKLGFVMLSFGVLVYLYYDWSLKQAMCMRDVLANGAGRMEFTSADLFLYGWFALTMIVGMVLLVRKGFGDDNRFAEAEQFPIGYYAIASIAFAVAVDVLTTGLRVLAEFQVLGAGGDHVASSGVRQRVRARGGDTAFPARVLGCFQIRAKPPQAA